MKPQLVLTQIDIEKKYIQLSQTIGFQTMPSELNYEFGIHVSGRGDFGKYIKEGVLDHTELLLDILEGELEIVGKANIK